MANCTKSVTILHSKPPVPGRWRGPWRSGAGRIAAICAALALPGCSWFAADEDAPGASAASCPAVLILDGAERTVAYAPGRERQSDGIVHLAAIRDLSSRCTYDGEGVEVDLRLTAVAEAGPAYRGEPVDVELFIATVGPDQSVLGKRSLALRLDIPEGAARAGRVEEISLRLPLSSPERASTRRLFVGFQLDPGEARERIDRFLR